MRVIVDLATQRGTVPLGGVLDLDRHMNRKQNNNLKWGVKAEQTIRCDQLPTNLPCWTCSAIIIPARRKV